MLDAARKSSVERYNTLVHAFILEKHQFQHQKVKVCFPEPSNLGYGWAKRVGELQAKIAKEFGMKVSIIRPMNAYGPRDDFDPETSHVIPALIRKIINAKTEVLIWGSGNQTRAFVYVDDVKGHANDFRKINNTRSNGTMKKSKLKIWFQLL